MYKSEREVLKCKNITEELSGREKSRNCELHNTFSAGILATHSLLGFSVLGVGGRLSRSRDWLFLSLYTVR